MDVFIGVDGSSSLDDDEYHQAFAYSFIRKIHDSWGRGYRYYLRGPGTMGTSTLDRSRALVKHVLVIGMANLIGNKSYRLFLFGHSRGGAIVIHAAKSLKNHGINVHGMFLFDAVDMSTLRDVDRIPTNVEYCWHAMREKATVSRPNWGNCGTTASPPTIYEPKKFFCTHGGMGGVSRRTLTSDGYISEALSRPNDIRFGPVYGALNTIHHGIAATKVRVDQEYSNSENVRQWMMARLQLRLAKADGWPPNPAQS